MRAQQAFNSLLTWFLHLVLPISSLDPEVLMEGQSFRLAASCRAMGRPTPLISWDTELQGQVQNRTKNAGSVSSFFSLHPLRSMNGKKLDCLVWHPAFKQPRRIPNQLVVQCEYMQSVNTSRRCVFGSLQSFRLVALVVNCFEMLENNMEKLLVFLHFS